MSTARHAVGRRRLRSRFTTRAAILAVIVGGLLLASIPVFGRFFSMRSQEAGLEQQVSTLVRENQQLAARIKQYRDPAYLEQLARECLGMVKPGEVRFSIPPEHGAPRPPAC
jgi:cell division protein FtsB